MRGLAVAGVVGAHLAAWFVPVIGLALLTSIWPPIGPGLDIWLSDTSFVVFHSHFTLLPFVLVGAVTFVAWRCHALNLAIRLSWFAALLHLAVSLLLFRGLGVPTNQAKDITTVLIPTDPTLGYLYLGSALATLAFCLAGSAHSVIKSVRAPQSRPG